MQLNIFQAADRAKEKAKEDARRLKQLGQNLLALFKELKVDYQTVWEDLSIKIKDHEAFKAIENEADRKQIFQVRFQTLPYYFVSKS